MITEEDNPITSTPIKFPFSSGFGRDENGGEIECDRRDKREKMIESEVEKEEWIGT